MYDYLDLDGCVKMYAQIIASDLDEGRGAIHMRLCELLGVKKEDFKPFEYDVGGEAIGNYDHAYWVIRRAIMRLESDRRKADG